MKLIAALVLLAGLVAFINAGPTPNENNPPKPHQQPHGHPHGGERGGERGGEGGDEEEGDEEEGDEGYEYEDEEEEEDGVLPTKQCRALKRDFRWPTAEHTCKIIRRTNVSRCENGIPGENDMVHLTNSFSDCVDLEEMGCVLAARFWMVPLVRLFLKFFKWITMSTPHDYKSAGTQCFFRILLKQKIPVQYLARLSEDKVNLCKMQMEIPSDTELLAVDFFDDPIQSGIRLATSFGYLACNIYDVLGPIALTMFLDPTIALKLVEAGIAIVTSITNLDIGGIMGGLGMGKPISEPDLIDQILFDYDDGMDQSNTPSQPGQSSHLPGGEGPKGHPGHQGPKPGGHHKN